MKTLLMVEGSLTPSCTKSHITYAFGLNNSVTGINIHFEYEPKILKDINLTEVLVKVFTA